MGFLKNIISNAIGEGISQGISKAVSSSTEKVIKPAAEKWANETAKSINTATAETIFSTVLVNFPKWDYTAIEEVSNEEEDEYICVMVAMELTDDLIEKYQEVLKQNGFTGNWQIMEKHIDGRVHKIDFTFVSDGYINYYIFK